MGCGASRASLAVAPAAAAENLCSASCEVRLHFASPSLALRGPEAAEFLASRYRAHILRDVSVPEGDDVKVALLATLDAVATEMGAIAVRLASAEMQAALRVFDALRRDGAAMRKILRVIRGAAPTRCIVVVARHRAVVVRRASTDRAPPCLVVFVDLRPQRFPSTADRLARLLSRTLSRSNSSACSLDREAGSNGGGTL
jgi:hypothetical protein